MPPYCEHCGADKAAKYCGECGRPQGSNPARPGIDYEALDKERTRGAGGDEVLFEGTTWPMCILSPMCCASTKWKITNKKIDFDHGYCHNHSDTVDLRRVKDLAFRRNPVQMCFGRGTVMIYSDAQHHNRDSDEKDKPLHFSRMGARRMYIKLRTAWSDIKSGVVG